MNQAPAPQALQAPPPDLAPAATGIPAEASRPPLPEPRFFPATKSAPMHLIDRPSPQQAPQQQAMPRNAR